MCLLLLLYDRVILNVQPCMWNQSHTDLTENGFMWKFLCSCCYQKKSTNSETQRPHMLIAQQSRLVGHSSFSKNLDYRRKRKLTYCIIITDKVTGNSKIGILPEYSLLPGPGLYRGLSRGWVPATIRRGGKRHVHYTSSFNK